VSEIHPRDVYIIVNGLRLHYLEWDNPGRPVLLLLHGLTSHAHSWDHCAATLHGAGYRLIALDQRGHGESDWAPAGAYALEDHFVDLCAVIDMIAAGTVTIVGHSMGGRNALFYAACHPERLSRLILIEARPGNSAPAARTLRDHLMRLPLTLSLIHI